VDAETVIACMCGKVGLKLTARPIMTVECTCDSCRAAAEIFAALPGASRIDDQRGATRHVMYRKDRVRCVRGRELLREFRLKPGSATRRVVASCCNAPMFLDFTKGHWVDMFACRWPGGGRPSPQMRTMVGDLPTGSQLPDDIPNLKGHSVGFFARLMAAWVAMRFRTPKLDFVKGALDVSNR
jgi:hypothetical protein